MLGVNSGNLKALNVSFAYHIAMTKQILRIKTHIHATPLALKENQKKSKERFPLEEEP